MADFTDLAGMNCKTPLTKVRILSQFLWLARFEDQCSEAKVCVTIISRWDLIRSKFRPQKVPGATEIHEGGASCHHAQFAVVNYTPVLALRAAFPEQSQRFRHSQ